MGRQRFEALDGLRGVAALAVVLYHAADVTGVPLSPGGFLSVDLFFVLSGFVIALSYERRLNDGLSLAGFLRARARRLLPIHFWAIGIVTSVTLVACADGDPRVGANALAILITAALNAFFMPAAVGYATHAPFPINPPLWSLWDEWIVNIIYATSMFGARLRTVAVAAAVSATFTMWFGWRFFGGWNFALLPSIFRALAGFAAGVLIYRAYMSGWLRKLPQVRPLWIYAGWILICANPRTEDWFAYEVVAAIVLAPLTVALLVRADGQVGPVFRRLGALSYPLYVSHLAVLILVGMIVRHWGLGPSALFAIPVTALALVLAQIVLRLSEISVAPALNRFVLRRKTV